MLEKRFRVNTAPAALPENMITEGSVRITVLTDRLFRLELSETEEFCDEATQAVWFRRLPAVAFRTERAAGELRIVTERAVLVWKGTMEESYLLFRRENKRAALGNEGNLFGTCRTLDCCDGDRWIPYDNDESKARRIILENGVVSKSGVAVMDDSASLLLREDGTLERRKYPEQDYYVFAYGQEYRESVRALYAICGTAPLIPRYALGNWWSRYHAYTEKEYLHTIENFEARGIPLTVATVDMDWHWSETLDERKQISAQGKNDEWHGGNDGWTGYSWNTDLFPDYRRFLKKLHEKGLHVTLNLHPAQGVRYFEDCYPRMAEAMGVDPETERQIPFAISDERFLSAYFDILHRPYERDGVDFWWIDWQQGSESGLEGLDPLWALNHYHFLDHAAEHKPLILSRYCGIGSHRYPVGFSGDTRVTWDTLRYLPYFTATASNIGYGWWSHDIGGHMNGCKDDELYVRFLQFGVFSPVNRLHCTNSPVFTKEPWAYANGAGLIAEEYLRLRHRMIPFLYSASYETAEQGLQLVEPLYYQWPEREEAYRYPGEYLFGRQLLVAPITEKGTAEGMARVPVWLPEGHWTDLFTGEEYSGGRELTLVRWLEEIPVLLREGGFFVLDDRETTNSAANPDRLKVYVTNGSGSYTLSEDWEGRRSDTVFRSESEDGVQRVAFFWKADAGTAAERQYRFWFSNLPSGEVTVLADGTRLQAVSDDNGRLSVLLEHVVPGVSYEIRVNYRPQAEEKRKETIRRSITRLQMENDRKNRLFEELCAARGEDYRRTVLSAPILEIAKEKLLEIEA